MGPAIVASHGLGENSAVISTAVTGMSHAIFFAHANGFPSATYGKLFQALAPEFEVRHLDMHGHDPRFPVNANWANLVDELLFHLEAQGAPVWGVGHSLGGLLHYHAALRRPELYRVVLMLDSPTLTFADQWVIRAAKRFGFIDRITPAGRTLGRREAFADFDEALRYFGGKSLFRSRLVNTAGALSLAEDEIVANVDDMDLSYLVSGASTYVAAASVPAAGWGNVVAVRIQLHMTGVDRVDGAPIERTLEHVVAVRNRVL